MNKVELANKYAELNEVTKKEALENITSVFNVIKDCLETGEEVDIYGFGKFGIKDVAEKTGVLQLGERKGETYTTPAHKAPTFKYSKTVKDSVR